MRRQEEIDDPEYTYWTRGELEGHHEQMMEEHRQSSAIERQLRRDEGIQGRFTNTKEELKEIRKSMLAILVHHRRLRLHEREMTRPKPKAPPQGVR
eukprot:2376335-Amphidinium_carterae.1